MVQEDVVEHGDTDDLTYHADDDREGDTGAEELVGSDYGEDYLTGEEDAADADKAENHRCPDRVDVFWVDRCHGAET